MTKKALPEWELNELHIPDEVTPGPKVERHLYRRGRYVACLSNVHEVDASIILEALNRWRFAPEWDEATVIVEMGLGHQGEGIA